MPQAASQPSTNHTQRSTSTTNHDTTSPSAPPPMRNGVEQYQDADDDFAPPNESQPLLGESHPSESTKSGPARLWETSKAALDVYRTAIASRLSQSRNSRGKQRSVGGEGTASNGSTSSPREHPARARLRALKADVRAVFKHPVVRAVLITLAAILLLILLLLGIEAAHLFTSTLSSPSEEAQARILDEALVLEGPDSVRLLNISEQGIHVRVDGRLGLDPDHALDIWLGQRRDEGWWKRKDRDIVEWALAKVGGVKVELGQLKIAEPDWNLRLEEEELDLFPDPSKDLAARETRSQVAPFNTAPPRDLLTFNLDPLFVPIPELLRTSRWEDDDDDDNGPIFGGNGSRRARLTMRPLNLTLLFKPVTPAPYLVKLGQRAISEGNATLDIKVDSLNVKGISSAEMDGRKPPRGWNVPSLIRLGQRDIVRRVLQRVPKVDPGESTGDLLNLTRYDFFEINPDKHNSSDVQTEGTKALGIRAYAQVKNPLGSLLKGHVKYSLPFGIYLPINDVGNKSQSDRGDSKEPVKDTVLLAAVASEPIDLDGQDLVPLVITGRVVPPPPSLALEAPAARQHRVGQAPFSSVESGDSDVHAQDSAQEDALGNFLSRFLRGENNTVYVRGGSPFEKGSPEADPNLPGLGSQDLPEWLASTLTVLDLPIAFPGSKVTDLIKNVTIHDLQIKPHPWSAEKLLFSGTIMGEMGLPGELAAVDVAIRYLWPDILVFDGKPPSMRHGGGGGDDGDGDGDGDGDIPDDGGDDDDDDDDDARHRSSATPTDEGSDPSPSPSPEPVPPLPSPLPKGAFGRVRPHTWANATTFVDPTDPLGQRKILRSELKDVPFTVLPGRSAEFRAFTWKLITGGAEAGIEGSSRVKIWNSGLGNLEIRALPVSGAFMVGGSK